MCQSINRRGGKWAEWMKDNISTTVQGVWISWGKYRGTERQNVNTLAHCLDKRSAVSTCLESNFYFVFICFFFIVFWSNVSNRISLWIKKIKKKVDEVDDVQHLTFSTTMWKSGNRHTIISYLGFYVLFSECSYVSGTFFIFPHKCIFDFVPCLSSARVTHPYPHPSHCVCPVFRAGIFCSSSWVATYALHHPAATYEMQRCNLMQPSLPWQAACYTWRLHDTCNFSFLPFFY